MIKEKDGETFVEVSNFYSIIVQTFQVHEDGGTYDKYYPVLHHYTTQDMFVMVFSDKVVEVPLNNIYQTTIIKKEHLEEYGGLYQWL